MNAFEEHGNPERNKKPSSKPCEFQIGIVINLPQRSELVSLKLLRIFDCIKESSSAFRDIIGYSGLLKNSADYLMKIGVEWNLKAHRDIGEKLRS